MSARGVLRDAALPLRPWALPLLLLAVWEACGRTGLVSAFLLPPPSQVIATIARLGAEGTLAVHVATSAARVLGGFFVGASIGVALGLLVGMSRSAEAWLDPSLQAVRSVPSLAWVPLLILWLGIGELPKVTLIAVGSFFPVYLGVASGVREVDPRFLEIGRVFGFNRAQTIFRIILPASLASLLTGLRTSLAVAWLYVVAAELLAAHSGLGFLLTDGRELSRSDLIFSAILLLALCGKLSDGVLKVIERRLLVGRTPAPAGLAPRPPWAPSGSPILAPNGSPILAPSGSPTEPRAPASGPEPRASASGPGAVGRGDVIEEASVRQASWRERPS